MDELCKKLIDFDIPIDDDVRNIFQRVYPTFNKKRLKSTIDALMIKNKEWLRKKGYRNNVGVKLKDYDWNITNLFGYDIKKRQLEAQKNKGIKPPPRKKRKLPNQIQPDFDVSDDDKTDNDEDIDIDLSDMDKLKRLLKSEKAQKATMNVLKELNPNLSISTNTISDPTATTPLSSPDEEKWQSIAKSVQDLQQLVKENLGNPRLKDNPHVKECDLSLDSPVRGLRKTVDYDDMMVVVKRIREITIGTPLKKEMKDVVKKMNTVTNKELCQHLQGLLYPFHFYA